MSGSAFSVSQNVVGIFEQDQANDKEGKEFEVSATTVPNKLIVMSDINELSNSDKPVQCPGSVDKVNTVLLYC